MIIQTIKKSIIGWITFCLTVLIFSIWYAAITNIWTNTWDLEVNNSSVLTSSWWNKLLWNFEVLSWVLNNANTRLDNLELNSWWWIWYSQTRQDLTSSRVNDTIYTNNTWKPIVVSVSTVNSNTVSAHWWYVDNVLVSIVGSMASRRSNVVLVVPNWSTYRVWWNGTNSIVNWSELR